jgi:hypothetical protein
MVEQYFDFMNGAVSGAAEQVSATFPPSNEPVLGGFRVGAQVATARGLVAIEDLVKSDLILSRDNGYIAFDDVYRMPVTNVGATQHDVLLSRDVLGTCIPAKDIYVAPSQLIVIHDDTGRDETFLSASDLVIRYRGVRLVAANAQRYNIVCRKHDVILVDGIWVGTGYSHETLSASLMDAGTMGRMFAAKGAQRLARPVADASHGNVTKLRSNWG